MNYINRFCLLRSGKIISTGGTESFGVLPSGASAELMYERLRLSYPKFYKMDSMCKLGYLASEILLGEDALKDHSPENVAIALSNSRASEDADKKFHASMAESASPSLFVYTLPNIVIGEISIRHKLKGETAFFVTSQFEVSLVHDYVEMLLSDGGTEACIGGWVDVADDHYDVLLYLVEKQRRGKAVNHTPLEIDSIYRKEIWKN